MYKEISKNTGLELKHMCLKSRKISDKWWMIFVFILVLKKNDLNI